MSKKFKARKSTGINKRSPNQLTAMDFVLVAVLVGSIAGFLIAYATARVPLDGSYLIYPMLIGAAVGILAGLLINLIKRQESPVFLVGLMAVCGALLAGAAVTSLNRPLDRSEPRSTILKIFNKYEQGRGKQAKYFLEVEAFTPSHLRVEEKIYRGVKIGGTVELLLRQGFFGYAYLEQVQLVKLDLEPEPAPVSR